MVALVGERLGEEFVEDVFGFGSEPVNGITILHADGTAAVYAHMKNGSVTKKAVRLSISDNVINRQVAAILP